MRSDAKEYPHHYCIILYVLKYGKGTKTHFFLIYNLTLPYFPNVL